MIDCLLACFVACWGVWEFEMEMELEREMEMGMGMGMEMEAGLSYLRSSLDTSKGRAGVGWSYLRSGWAQ